MSIKEQIQKLFDAGAHVGFSRARRHPSMQKFIFDQNGRTDIFDLEKTNEQLESAAAFAKSVTEAGKQILFVGGKNEARAILRTAAEKASMPFVDGRWIGGTLTNFSEISKRVKRLEKLRNDREKGNLDKYTKKERLLISREVEDLEAMFGGLISMKERPAALCVIDPRHEEKAIAEARKMGIPVIALSSSDCDVRDVAYPVPANDATAKSIEYFTNAIVKAIAK